MKTYKYFLLNIVLFMILLPGSVSILAREKIELKVHKVTENLHCISNAGGNIAVLQADRKLLLIDAGHARLADDVSETLYGFSPFPVKMLINTHYHRDHTGGNPVLGKNAVIIAHENCRLSMMAGLQPEESPAGIGIPSETFKTEKEIKWGNETIRLIHFGPGHTNGDIVVIFTKARVVHTGDLFFNGIAPYIDVKNGSDTGNWIKTIRLLVKTYPDFTVIPGHGPITDMKTFLKFADYLEYLRQEVKKTIVAGKTRDQAMESVDVTAYNHLIEHGNFMTRKNNIGWIYDELIRH
jgi:glyoxylase-like metal-dependent hydrolase (beta-lactamase superfamily II)